MKRVLIAAMILSLLFIFSTLRLNLVVDPLMRIDFDFCVFLKYTMEFDDTG